MGKCCNLSTIFITRYSGANVNHLFNPSTRKAYLANFFLLWTQPCTHFGCNFYWCQAILKKILDLKISAAYKKKVPNPIRSHTRC